MLSTKIENELNTRIQDETYAAYLYWSISAYLETLNLKGFAQWMRAQAKEELTHAMRNYEFLLARGGTATLRALAAPPAKWASAEAAIAEAYGHEQKVTGIYNQFMEVAQAEKDFATIGHIQWFVTEQVEEEEQTLEMLQKVKMVEKSPGALMALDHQLGKRE